MRYALALIALVACDEPSTSTTGCQRSQAAWCRLLMRCDMSLEKTIGGCIAALNAEAGSILSCTPPVEASEEAWDQCAEAFDGAGCGSEGGPSFFEAAGEAVDRCHEAMR